MKFLEFARKLARENINDIRDLNYPQMKKKFDNDAIQDEIDKLDISKQAKSVLADNIFNSDLSYDRLIQQICMYVTLLKTSPTSVPSTPKQDDQERKSPGFTTDSDRKSPDMRAPTNKQQEKNRLAELDYEEDEVEIFTGFGSK
jgi:hypothetical protein